MLAVGGWAPQPEMAAQRNGELGLVFVGVHGKEVVARRVCMIRPTYDMLLLEGHKRALTRML